MDIFINFLQLYFFMGLISKLFSRRTRLNWFVKDWDESRILKDLLKEAEGIFRGKQFSQEIDGAGWRRYSQIKSEANELLGDYNGSFRQDFIEEFREVENSSRLVQNYKPLRRDSWVPGFVYPIRQQVRESFSKPSWLCESYAFG
jgi:hypothetical protein